MENKIKEYVCVYGEGGVAVLGLPLERIHCLHHELCFGEGKKEGGLVFVVWWCLVCG